MSYAVKEIFYTLHGEGANAGRPAVFCRFSADGGLRGLRLDDDRLGGAGELIERDGRRRGAPRTRRAASLGQLPAETWITAGSLGDAHDVLTKGGCMAFR